MSFSLAHTFYISSEAVQGASIAQLSAIELFFKFKPRQSNNKSGIESPGASLIIVPTDINNNPVISATGNDLARLEYDQIVSSSDASQGSRFVFPNPVMVSTNRWYAFAVKFDGNEDYVLWTSVTGDSLVGTDTASPGKSGDYVGSYFELLPSEGVDTEVANTSTNMVTAPSTTPINSLWRPRNNTFLKFKIFAARFFSSGVPIDNDDDNVEFADGNFQIGIPFRPMEYVVFDTSQSRFGSKVTTGVKLYQNTVFWPGGFANASSSISLSVQSGNAIVVANTNYPNGTPFNWNDVYDQGEDVEYIVITSQSHSSGQDVTVVRVVQEILSNVRLRLSETMPISNSGAKFMKSPVAIVRQDATKRIRGVNRGMLALSDSNANLSTRFVSGAIANLAVNAGGSGYHNSDVLYVYGFENEADKFEGGYLAVANLVTNSTGGITALYLSNVGAYLMNTSAIGYRMANSSAGYTGANTSNGTSATFTINVGSVMKAETFSQDQFYSECEMYSQAISHINPIISVVAPTGTTYKLKAKPSFERQATANLAAGHYDRPKASILSYTVQPGVGTVIDASSNSVNMTRSEQYSSIYANGNSFAPIKIGGTRVNNALIVVEGSSNNDFVSFRVDGNPIVWLSTFMINNDYTNEHTDAGNAWSKHVSNKLNFDESRFAEDLLVYVTAHKPVGTDIQVYGRMHSSLDTEDEFNDKDWTRLDCIAGNGAFSDVSNQNDLREYTYGIPQSPNTDLTLAGTVTVTTGNNQVVGVGTAFNTNLVAGDLVKISAPLFPNNHFIAVVNTVVGATAINLDFTTANASVLGSGMKIERIRTFKKQSFRNHQNDNVATYFAENGAAFDKFDTFSVKVVLLSNNQSIIPSIDNIYGLGTTA